jgi:hypothetical protein
MRLFVRVERGKLVVAGFIGLKNGGAGVRFRKGEPMNGG